MNDLIEQKIRLQVFINYLLVVNEFFSRTSTKLNEAHISYLDTIFISNFDIM